MEVAESQERRGIQLNTKINTDSSSGEPFTNLAFKQDKPLIKTVSPGFFEFLLAYNSFQSFGKSWQFQSSVLPKIQISFKNIH